MTAFNSTTAQDVNSAAHVLVIICTVVVIELSMLWILVMMAAKHGISWTITIAVMNIKPKLSFSLDQ